jgi:hypothetical protein
MTDPLAEAIKALDAAGIGLTVVSIELPPDVRAAAYRAGLCIGCGSAPHSPGRIRCDTCYRAWQTTPPPGGIDPDLIYSHELCVGRICVREGKTGRFRVRHDSGLCEFCTAHQKIGRR